jgi:E3 SUMO-protein ligase RanBP2
MTQARLESLKKMLAADPSNPLAHYGLATEFWKSGDAARTVEHLTAYLQKTDDQGAGYRMLGQAYQKLGDVAGAREAFESGRRAAEWHGHPTMAAEIGELIDALDD